VNEGQFTSPWSIASDRHGHTYVGDLSGNGSDRILRLSGTGQFQTVLHDGAAAMAADSVGRLFVASTQSASFVRYTVASGEKLTIATVDPNTFFFHYVGVATDSIGNVYTSLTDQPTDANNRLVEYDGNGIVRHQAPFGNDVGGGLDITAVAIGSVGTSHRVDALTNASSIARFDSALNLVTCCIDVTAGGLHVGRNSAGLSIGLPGGAAYDCAGNLYVVDTPNNRIVKIVENHASSVCSSVSRVLVQPVSLVLTSTPTPSTAALRVGCPAVVCSGRVAIHLIARRAADIASATGSVLGQAGFSVRGGLAQNVLVRLDAAGRALLKAHPGSKVELVATLSGRHPRTVIERHAALKASAQLALGCHAKGTAGQPLPTTAKLSLHSGGKPVTFVYTRPDGSGFYGVSSTAGGGQATNVISPKAVGPWTAAATWPGDSRYFETHTSACTFSVAPAAHG
jgi:hypothetical protein